MRTFHNASDRIWDIAMRLADAYYDHDWELVKSLRKGCPLLTPQEKKDVNSIIKHINFAKAIGPERVVKP